MNTKQIFAILILLALCVYSVIMAMQTLAIVAITLFLGVLYKGHTGELFELGKSLLSSARQAKFAGLELTIERKLESIGQSSNAMARKVAWARVLISSMTTKDLGLLLSISKAERFKAIIGLKPRFRALRDLGLVQHDADTMEASQSVWLTELGIELAELLMEASDPDGGSARGAMWARGAADAGAEGASK